MEEKGGNRVAHVDMARVKIIAGPWKGRYVEDIAHVSHKIALRWAREGHAEILEVIPATDPLP